MEPIARALFDVLASQQIRRALSRAQAKTPEKRAAKIKEMVAKLARGETFIPARANSMTSYVALLRAVNVEF